MIYRGRKEQEENQYRNGVVINRENLEMHE